MFRRIKKALQQRFTKLANQIAARWATQIFWEFDSQEAKGVVQVVKGAYGVYVNFPDLFGKGSAVALADLFYRSPGWTKDNDEPGPYAVQVYGQEHIDDDPVHREEYWPEEVR